MRTVLFIVLSCCFTSCQVTQIASQPQVQAELTLRLTQLQTRLASLKIENEEVRNLNSGTNELFMKLFFYIYISKNINLKGNFGTSLYYNLVNIQYLAGK